MNTSQFSKPLICWIEKANISTGLGGRICIDPHANKFPIFILAFLM